MKKQKTFIAIAMALALSGCSAPATTATSPDNSAEMESLKAQVEELKKENGELKAQLATTEAPTTEAPTVAAGSVLSIGDEGTLKDWTIVITNAEITDSIKENDYYGFSPEEGNKYLAIDITATNNGKNAATFLPSFGLGDDISAKLLYQGEYEFSATNLLGYSKSLFDTTVNPLSTKSGLVAFELPDSVASAEEELILVISAGKNDIQFKVR